MTRPHNAYKVTISNDLLISISVEHPENVDSFIFVLELTIMHSSSSTVFSVSMLRDEIC